MTDPLVVLVLVAAGGASEPATSSMTAAARQALGASTLLLFEERTSLPSEEQAVALAERVRATAVAEVDWVGPARTHAILHVHTAQGPGWAERQIDFAPSDPPAESGRTIGFALASMITRLGAPAAAPELPAPAAPPEAPEASPPSPSTSTFPSASVGAHGAPTPATPAPSSGKGAPPQEPREAGGTAPAVAKSLAIEVVALASSPPAGIGAAATAFGSVFPSLAGQLSGGVRFGSIPVPAGQATLTFSSVQLGGGATWKAAQGSGPRPVELDVRADVFATDLIVYRASASQSRWVPEARLEVEGVWFFVTPNVGMALAAGAEATLGTTVVSVGSDIVTRILPFRAVGTLGVRARF